MSLKITDNVDKFMKALDSLVSKEVLVGIPAAEGERKDGDPADNVLIGFVMEYGSPANNIPPRPTLIPGIQDVKDEVAERFRKAGLEALQGNKSGVEKHLNAAGMIARDSVKKKIGSNVPPPLKKSTLAARRGRKVTRTNTLIDTGQFRNSITYIVKGY